MRIGRPSLGHTRRQNLSYPSSGALSKTPRSKCCLRAGAVAIQRLDAEKLYGPHATGTEPTSDRWPAAAKYGEQVRSQITT